MSVLFIVLQHIPKPPFRLIPSIGRLWRELGEDCSSSCRSRARGSSPRGTHNFLISTNDFAYHLHLASYYNKHKHNKDIWANDMIIDNDKNNKVLVLVLVLENVTLTNNICKMRYLFFRFPYLSLFSNEVYTKCGLHHLLYQCRSKLLDPIIPNERAISTSPG